MASDPVVARREMFGLLRRGRMTSFDPSWFTYSGQTLGPDRVVEMLRPHISDERVQRIDDVLANRTYNLAVVVDGMVDTGNVSAVMRSADSFGVQAFHAVDRARSYKHSKRTAQGARKWVDRWVWREPADALQALRESGHRIVVADLDPAAAPIATVDFSLSTALVFGNELAGVSDEFREAADQVVAIEMSGFAQSLNISVAAAICLYEARRDRVARLGKHGDLTDEDKARLKAVFAVRSVQHARKIIERRLAMEAETPD
ncbi:MAG: RNA methyltransferase [bacterium]|nr:RNA methyltransferase [bacterium]